MAYMRYNSPGPSNDLMPGVCTAVAELGGVPSHQGHQGAAGDAIAR